MPEENEGATAEIAKEIKSGEKWLIGIGFATLIINTGIALIYWGQLSQMRAATDAATKASKTAADTLQEMRTGSGASDTHTLAQQAITQAAQTTNLASAAKEQSATTIRAANAATSAANTAAEAMYLEQRPWVAIQIIPAIPAPGTIITGPNIGIASYVIVARNTGKTPAIGWRSECCEKVTRANNEVVPNYDVLHDDIDSHISDHMRERVRTGDETIEQARDWVRKTRADEEKYTFESGVIAPGDTKPVSTSIQTYADDHLFHYTLGKFVYKDVLDPSKTHTTQFCIMTLGNRGSLELCRTGNDMN